MLAVRTQLNPKTQDKFCQLIAAAVGWAVPDSGFLLLVGLVLRRVLL